MKTKGTIFTMIVALIEKVYSFLSGRYDTHSTARAVGAWNVTAHNSFDSDGIYFTVRTRLFTDQNVSGHDKGADR